MLRSRPERNWVCISAFCLIPTDEGVFSAAYRKTTTMLFKMLWVERTFQLNNDMVKPRQVFVTKSRVLAGKVEEYFLKLLESLKTASQSPRELKELVKSRKARSDEEENLVDMDDEENWRSDLPTKFSKLLDSHFPLFITFDHVSLLLDFIFNH